MRYLIAMVAFSLLIGGVSAQEKGEAKSSGSSKSAKSEKETKLRGVLPAYFKQLGVTDDQRQSIYKIQNEYADKLDDLEKKVEELKAERNKKYLAALTKAQRERLDELKKGKDDDK
jgi:TolA-binding protein